MRTFAALLASALLAGCEPPAPPPPDPNARHLEKAVQEPLDRARAVEAEVKAASERQAREIEEGGG